MSKVGCIPKFGQTFPHGQVGAIRMLPLVRSNWFGRRVFRMSLAGPTMRTAGINPYGASAVTPNKSKIMV